MAPPRSVRLVLDETDVVVEPEVLTALARTGGFVAVAGPDQRPSQAEDLVEEADGRHGSRSVPANRGGPGRQGEAEHGQESEGGGECDE